MNAGCRRAGILLERRGPGLAEADALRLEEHLAACARCREEARLLDSILRADADGLTARPAGAGARALRRALDQAVGRPAEAARAGRSRTLAIALGLTGAVAAAALALALWPRGEADQPTRSPEIANATVAPAAEPASPAAVDRVEVGMVTSDGMPYAAGDPVAADRRLTVEREARLALAHARVEASIGSALEWRARERTLRVHAGRVQVAVDPAPRRLVRVVTDRFAVEVLGTTFAVDPGGVAVSAGTVRVVASDGAVLVDALGAGQSWRMDVQPVGERGERPVARDGDSARELLSRARSLIAAADAGGARRAARAALDLRPAAADAAEARTLLAECALLDGKDQLAVRLYLEVSRRHRALPAGETALFLAARVADDKGDRRAAAILERYLDTYPAGRFRVEARRRLAKLTGR